MKKQFTAVLVSLVAGGVLTGAPAQGGILSGDAPQLHRGATDHVPALSFPERCRGEVDGSVPLLTFFFFDDEKTTREPDTVMSMFPCGSVQDDVSGLPGIVFPRQDEGESERIPRSRG